MNDLDFIFDTTNPRSLINRVSAALAKTIGEIPKEYFSMPESELVAKVYVNSKPPGKPPTTDCMLKVALWKKLKDIDGTMTMDKFCDGVCSVGHFRNFISRDHGRLAYIFSPPNDYSYALLEIEQYTIPEMRRIMHMEEVVNAKTGVPDYKLLELKFKIFQYIDTRIHGAAVQRHEVESKNLNVDVKATPKELGFKSVEEIDKRLAELERDKAQEALLPGEPPLEILPVQRVVQEAGRVTDMRYKE